MRKKTTKNTRTGVFYAPIDRRRFFKSMAMASAGFTLPGYLGEAQTTWDFVSQFTPVQPTYPNSGSLVVAGTAVAGPTAGNARYRISIPAYAGYSYEIYGNSTLASLAWRALPFSLTQTGTIDR